MAVTVLSFASGDDLTSRWPETVDMSTVLGTTDGVIEVSSFAQGSSAVLVFEWSEQSDELQTTVLEKWTRLAASAGLRSAPAQLGPQLGLPGGLEGFRYSIVPGEGGGLGVRC